MPAGGPRSSRSSHSKPTDPPTHGNFFLLSNRISQFLGRSEPLRDREIVTRVFEGLCAADDEDADADGVRKVNGGGKTKESTTVTTIGEKMK